MDITLISVDNDVAHHGLRSISSLLKSHGHNVKLIFLTTGNEMTDGNILSSALYPESVINQVKELTKDSDIVKLLRSNVKLLNRQRREDISKRAGIYWCNYFDDKLEKIYI